MRIWEYALAVTYIRSSSKFIVQQISPEGFDKMLNSYHWTLARKGNFSCKISPDGHVFKVAVIYVFHQLPEGHVKLFVNSDSSEWFCARCVQRGGDGLVCIYQNEISKYHTIKLRELLLM